ncbi:FadR family transcriptional regulator [Dactylosporangium roseum]|uniref:FadR family transcriptional regulator n=1 Tax=Dactylosporangium roseum TaxID=47989 RepID=A0ABY5YZJ8_9ACTN|nr:FCD domain-containing protein [Dactylosporangium roseum]UWZ34819.1 FadR family transcriptional regulator [Dactylosporangium roseum]
MSERILDAIPEQRRAAGVVLARDLMRYLLSGRFAPGQKIPSERQLTEELSAGRSAVREALKSLSLLGLVEQRVGDGTYLARSSSELLPQAIQWGLLLEGQDAVQLVEVRRHLEVWAARLAAERRTDEQVDRLRTVIGVGPESRRTGTAGEQPVAVEVSDRSLHEVVAEMTGNAVLVNLLNTLRSLLQVDSSTVRAHARRRADGDQELLRAIEQSGLDAAGAAMATHLDDCLHPVPEGSYSRPGV